MKMTAALIGGGDDYDDQRLFSAVLLFMYISCPLTVLSLHFLSAPYGRHARPGWGPSVPAAVAWFVMESPTLWLTAVVYPLGRQRSHPIAIGLVALYLFHYIHRTIIYPLRLRRRQKKEKAAAARPFPVSVALMAFTFNIFNAYLQIRSVSHYAHYPPPSGLKLKLKLKLNEWGRVLLGGAVFFWGMWVNVRSDLALVRLKAESGGGYRIPRGGWFDLVASPNYMGEAAEWLGWAIIAWSPAALAFFLYTFSNLGPRARAHLAWFRQKFGPDYPPNRKAIIPFIY